jgi:cell division protein FtsZ
MGDIVLPKAGIHQAFAMADTTISQSVRAIVNIVRRPGIIRIGFDELLSALRSQNSRCLFGFGESDSDNRAHEALAMALKNPLMNRGKMLAEAQAVLVHITGGPGMTLTEVEIVMQELNRHVEDHTQILFGTSVDGKMGARMSVTLISSLSGEAPLQAAPLRTMRFPEPEPLPVAAPAPPVAEAVPEIEEPIPPQIADVAATEPEAAEQEEILAIEEPAAAPLPIKKGRKPVPRREPAPLPDAPELIVVPTVKKEKSVQPRQEVMQFEPVTRGRFEKSEPTIEEGQDLDVPTFLRKNARIK